MAMNPIRRQNINQKVIIHQANNGFIFTLKYYALFGNKVLIYTKIIEEFQVQS